MVPATTRVEVIGLIIEIGYYTPPQALVLWGIDGPHWAFLHDLKRVGINDQTR